MRLNKDLIIHLTFWLFFCLYLEEKWECCRYYITLQDYIIDARSCTCVKTLIFVLVFTSAISCSSSIHYTDYSLKPWSTVYLCRLKGRRVSGGHLTYLSYIPRLTCSPLILWEKSTCSTARLTTAEYSDDGVSTAGGKKWRKFDLIFLPVSLCLAETEQWARDGEWGMGWEVWYVYLIISSCRSPLSAWKGLPPRKRRQEATYRVVAL